MIPLRDYQISGVQFLSERPRALLLDDTGLGKTAQFIRAADARLAHRVLVICQAISQVSWGIEIPKWAVLHRPTFMIRELKEPVPTGPITAIVSADWFRGKSLDKLRRYFGKTERFDAVIIDEAQTIKDWSALRTRRVYGHRLDLGGVVTRFGFDAGDPPPVWIGSATLTPNHAGELYTHVRSLLPQVLFQLFGRMASADEFTRRYCNVIDGDFGLKVEGNNSHTIPELKRALAPYILSRNKRDVLKELPQLSVIPLPLDIPKVNTTAFGLPADPSISQLEELMAQAEANPSVSTVRRELGMLKVNAVLPWVLNELNKTGNSKLVIFAHHLDVIAQLEKTISGKFTGELVKITGQTPPNARVSAVTEFQNNAKVRLFIGQTQAAGTSITLTAASTVLVLEPDWTPTNNYQAISRCHRMGQLEPVFAYFAHAHGTVDEHITRVLRRKAKDALQLLDKEIQGHI